MKPIFLTTLLALLASGASVAKAQSMRNPTRIPVAAPADFRTPIQSLDGSDTALHVITRPGSYYLAGNLAGVADRHGIEVLADDVTIDLMGFVAQGVSGSFHGIALADGRRGLTVRNGTLRGWGLSGLDAVGGVNLDRQCRVELVRAFDNGIGGIQAGLGGRVERSLAGRGLFGITAQEGQIDTCLAAGFSSIGIDMLGTGAIRRSIARESIGGGAMGFRLMNGGGTVVDSVCHAASVVVSSTDPAEPATIRGCVVTDSNHAAGGIQAYSSTRILENLSTGHASYGIRATGGRNHVEGNLTVGNGANALSVGSGMAVRNASTGNATGDNFDFFGTALAGSFIAPGTIGQITSYGHPLF